MSTMKGRKVTKIEGRREKVESKKKNNKRKKKAHTKRKNKKDKRKMVSQRTGRDWTRTWRGHR